MNLKLDIEINVMAVGQLNGTSVSFNEFLRKELLIHLDTAVAEAVLRNRFPPGFVLGRFEPSVRIIGFGPSDIEVYAEVPFKPPPFLKKPFWPEGQEPGY